MDDLIKNPLSEDSIDATIPTATYSIYSFIHDYLRRDPKDSTHINRASSATLCPKRRWYQKQGFEGTPLFPRKMINFLLGDLSEKTMQFFIQKGCVGPGKLYSKIDFGIPIGEFPIQGKTIMIYQQEDLTAQIGDLTVTAHVDGWGKRNSDNKWELIECKSAADYGFDKFKDEGPGDYLKQAHVNMKTTKAIELGVNSVRFFYLRKNTGHLWDRLFNFDQTLFDEVIEEYRIANSEQMPKAPYTLQPEMFRGKPTGRTVAKFPCTYCNYIKECHGEYKLEFKGLTPVYVFKE